MGPSPEPKQLRAALYALAPGDDPDEFIGGGRCGTSRQACQRPPRPLQAVLGCSAGSGACWAPGAVPPGAARCRAAAPSSGAAAQHYTPNRHTLLLPRSYCSCSLNLAHLEAVEQQHHVRVPIVSGAGAHLADLSLGLRFFHSRTPGGFGLPGAAGLLLGCCNASPATAAACEQARRRRRLGEQEGRACAAH